MIIFQQNSKIYQKIWITFILHKLIKKFLASMENIFEGFFSIMLRNIFSQIHINLVPDCYISSYMSLTNS